MDDEIDLRPYIALLIRNRLWILGAGFIIGLLTFGVSSLLPEWYKATALLAITEPTLRVQFDPRFQTLEGVDQPLQAFPELASSDAVLTQLLAELDSSGDSIRDRVQLRSILEATTGSHLSLIRLSATSQNPMEAASIANAWAEIFVTRAREVYGERGTDQLGFFTDRLASAEQELTSVENLVAQFQARNPIMLLENELEALKQSQIAYLDKQRTLTFLIRDVEALRSHLSSVPENSTVTFADQLTSLNLQLRTYGSDLMLPLQLQASADSVLTSGNRGEQIAFLELLKSSIEAQLSEVDEQLAELEPQILSVQHERQIAQTEWTSLERRYDVAEETYLALARKVEEERITSDNVDSVVKVASKAEVPLQPVVQHKVLYAVLSGVLGATIAAFLVLINGWWTSHSSLPHVREQQVEAVHSN